MDDNIESRKKLTTYLRDCATSIEEDHDYEFCYMLQVSQEFHNDPVVVSADTQITTTTHNGEITTEITIERRRV